MAVHKLRIEEVKENIFLDIEVPIFEKFKIKLTQKSKVEKIKKTGEETFRVDNYDLYIDTSEIPDTNLSETTEALKDIMGLPFTPYVYEEHYNPRNGEVKKSKTKIIKYFTHGKQTVEKKKEILLNIFEHLKDFEQHYDEKVADSVQAFNEDILEHQEYKDFDIAVKYNKENNAFFVLGLRFLGDKYKLLSKASHLMGKISEAPLPEDFFNDLVKLKKGKYENTFFMIKPDAYLEIKDLIEVQKQEQIIFKEEQKKLAENIEGELPIYTKENLFDLKIDFDKELNCFKFYCKGYDPGEYNGNQTSRNLLGIWALNYIYGQKLTDEEVEKLKEKNHYLNDDDEFFSNNSMRIDLNFLDGSSKKNKALLVSADQVELLRKIKENFLQIEAFFERPPEVIQVMDKILFSKNTNKVNVPINSYVGDLVKYPTILMNEKGKPFFIFSYRQQEAKNSKQNKTEEYGSVSLPMIPPRVTENDIIDSMKKKPRKIKDTLSSVTMTGIPISYEEMLYFMNEHIIAEKIKKNTIYLNTEMWGVSKDMNITTTWEEREEMFESISLHAKISNTTKEKTVAKKKKI